jgi:glucose-induced degradation protein 4
MPSERNVPFQLDHPQPEPQTQAKICSSCQLMLVDTIYRQEDSVLCGSCREKSLSARDGVYPDSHNVFIGSQVRLSQGVDLHPTRLGTEHHVDHDADVSSLSSSPSSSVFDSYSLSSEENGSTRLFDDSRIAVYSHASPAVVSAYPSHSSPDPLVDITHMRVRTRGRYCLYPGATFQGTQKSGKNSYDVNVTIVVCFMPSASIDHY